VIRGSQHPATQPVAVGRIDDDRDADEGENLLVEIMLAPFRWSAALVEAPVQQLKMLGGETPSRAARMTLDASSADNRRRGIFKLVEYPFAHKPPYTTRYEQMAKDDPDPTVRAAALRACNWARDRAATPLFISTLADTKEADVVRLEAAKGLCNLPDSAAVATLLGVAGTPDIHRDIRIASVDGLKYYRSLEVGRALGNLLVDRDFAVGWQARRSLVYMTHKDLGMDQGAWLGFIAGPEKPLE
jgi:HEAT repeat protein